MTTERNRLTPGVVRRFLEQAPELHPWTLRFFDERLETGYQRAYFTASLPYLRLAHVLGAVLWAAFWGFAQVTVTSGEGWDTFLRFGVGVQLCLIGLALTLHHDYGRFWRREIAVVLVLNAIVWSLQVVLVEGARDDWGYAGLIIILAFTFILSRLPFVDATVVAFASLVAFHVSWAATDQTALDLLMADYFLLSVVFIGMAGGYGLERGNRLLYLSEQRVDRLLASTLPRDVIDRLQARGLDPGSSLLADELPAVSVLFADLVGFTARSATIGPHDTAHLLDDVFRDFDELAERVGLEKIKTIGDAYMAVAGAPRPREDHAAAAAEMALGIMAVLADRTWPNGDPMRVRIGVASGPAVAGVIGREKFSYDLWGDTVNLASRLESNGIPGRILVSDGTFDLLAGRYAFEEPIWVELKGKGRTRAHVLTGPRG